MSPKTGTDYLQGYWRNNNLTTDGTWEDLSTNSNHGPVSGSPQTVIFPERTTSGRDINGFFLTHPNKNYLSCDGVATYISASDSPVFDFSSGRSFSVECWFKLNKVTGDQVLVAKQYQSSADGSDNCEWIISIVTTDLNFLISDDSENAFIGRSDATNLSVNTWYHAVCTYDGTATSDGIDIYLNATSADDTPQNSAATYVAMEALSQPITIGALGDGTKYLDGLIDDVRIYDRVLTPSEIEKNYKYGKGSHKNG